MFCAPELIFDGTEGIWSRFHILRTRTHFRGYQGRRLLFSCFARLDSFSAVPRASAPVFMFCAPGLVFGGDECVGTGFWVLRARTHFQRYRGRRDQFSCFARPGLIFCGTKGVDSSFHVLRSRTRFWRYRGHRVLFFLFSVPVLDFVGTKGDSSRINVLRAQTHFRRYRERRVKFSSFALPDSFSAVSMATTPVFMFCASRLIFGGNKGVGSRFKILRARTRFRRGRVRWVPFSCFARPD
jgi:hypothetical protein